jgi:hypothetical protein
LGWAAIAPDRIDTGIVRAVDQLAWVTGATASSLPVPDLSWAAVWPDQVRRTDLLTATQWTWAAPVSPVPSVTDIAWVPSCPSWIWQIVLPTAAQTTLAFGSSPSAFPVPDLAWAGVYPARIDRLVMRGATVPFFTSTIDTPTTVPPTGGNLFLYRLTDGVHSLPMSGTTSIGLGGF